MSQAPVSQASTHDTWARQHRTVQDTAHGQGHRRHDHAPYPTPRSPQPRWHVDQAPTTPGGTAIRRRPLGLDRQTTRTQPGRPRDASDDDTHPPCHSELRPGPDAGLLTSDDRASPRARPRPSTSTPRARRPTSTRRPHARRAPPLGRQENQAEPPRRLQSATRGLAARRPRRRVAVPSPQACRRHGGLSALHRPGELAMSEAMLRARPPACPATASAARASAS